MENSTTSIPPYSIIDDPQPSDSLWTQFAEAVRSEWWRDSDNTLFTLMPNLCTTRAVFAQTKKDDQLMGCVIWHETKSLAYIAYYYVKKELRGNGLGTKLWNRAMERILKELVVGLRSGASMSDYYKKKITPFEAARYQKFNVSVDVLEQFCEKYASKRRTDQLFLIRDLDEGRFEKFTRFDEKVTGSERSAILKKLFELETSEGSVLIDKNRGVRGKIIAHAAVVETGNKGGFEFKLSQLYCENVHQAAIVIQPLLEFCKKSHEHPTVLINVRLGTQGEDLVQKLKELSPDSVEVMDADPFPMLFSREHKLPFDLGKVWLEPNVNLLA